MKHTTLPLATAALLLASTASATPRALPFSYPYETLAQGEVELEQFADFSPVKWLSNTTGETWVANTRFTTEFEYGLTDRLELGLYLQLTPSPPGFSNGATFPGGNGIKQRLRVRLAEAGEWPVDVSLYGEVAELDNEIELEAKINLQKRIDRLTMMVNLWAEQEFYYSGRTETVLHPTAGLTYEVTPSFHPGVEYWMSAEYPNDGGQRVFNLGPHQYVGPTVLANFGRLWWTTGVYLRVTNMTHTMQLGESFGPLWVRSVIGLNL